MENKLFYIRGSKTNPERVKKVLLEKYPNMCNQSLVVWTKEDMLIYVDGDDCCSCCSYDSTVGRTLIKYGEEIQPLVNTTKVSTEANMFENAKFGDKFLTRGRRTAIYIKPSNHSDLFKHYLIVDGDDFLTGYYDDGRQTKDDKTINDIVLRSEDDGIVSKKVYENLDGDWLCSKTVLPEETTEVILFYDGITSCAYFNQRHNYFVIFDDSTIVYPDEENVYWRTLPNLKLKKIESIKQKYRYGLRHL